jgi:cyclophilin family peptidyl-prolyl cis-trans isomerase
MPSGRSYERRIKAKRDAARAARKRAEKMRKVRIGASIAAAVAVAVVLLIVLLNIGDNKPVATSPTTSPSASASSSPIAGCTQPTPAPTPNGKDFTTAPKMTIDTNKLYVATFQTSCGAVKMRMDPKTAPASVNNFVFLARQGYFDNTKLPRIQNNPGFQIIQAGSQNGTISGGVKYKYQGETPGPGAKYTRGTVAMANSQGPSTNGSQFFFVLSPATTALDSNPNYSIFGKVDDAASLATLDKILTAKGPPVDPSSDLGVTPNPPIYILKVTIEELKRG